MGIAISGGSDSTALLLLAHEWATARNARLHAATVDHGLRPEAADEARQVAVLCATLAIPHTTLRWNPHESGMGGHVSQAAARAARHRLLARWAADHGLTALALGHTADDRIETFLIRARAGSGWHGLAAPLPSAPSPSWPEGAGLRLVRPLLAVRRQTLRDHLTASGRPWLDDPTNTYDRHERVRARALAARLGPEAAARILAITARLARLRAAVMAEARAALAGTDLQPEAALVPRTLLDSLPEEPRRRLLEALVLAAGHAAAPPRSDLLLMDKPLTLAGAWLRPGRDHLAVTPAPPRHGAPAPLAPDWRRAAALLADPCAELLAA